MDLTKEHQTKCGHAIECLREDGVGGYVGFVRLPDCLVAVEWDCDKRCTHRGGCFEDKSDFDLIEKPRTVRISGWLNVYEDGSVAEYETRKSADNYGSGGRIACIPIDREVTYGEGLNGD